MRGRGELKDDFVVAALGYRIDPKIAALPTLTRQHECKRRLAALKERQVAFKEQQTAAFGRVDQDGAGDRLRRDLR